MEIFNASQRNLLDDDLIHCFLTRSPCTSGQRNVFIIYSPKHGNEDANGDTAKAKFLFAIQTYQHECHDEIKLRQHLSSTLSNDSNMTLNFTNA